MAAPTLPAPAAYWPRRKHMAVAILIGPDELVDKYQQSTSLGTELVMGRTASL
jgi:hypothetical protein